jgi:hypothetical protein
MTDLFPSLVIGHLIGDYLLQNKWMAMNKSGSTFKCAVHCLIYTAAVTAVTWPYLCGWQWSLFVFATHFPIDRWSLADKWLKMIDSRSLEDFIMNGKSGIPADIDRENYHALRGGFTAFVYAVADNTMHLAAMYFGAAMLFR